MARCPDSALLRSSRSSMSRIISPATRRRTSNCFSRSSGPSSTSLSRDATMWIVLTGLRRSWDTIDSTSSRARTAFWSCATRRFSSVTSVTAPTRRRGAPSLARRTRARCWSHRSAPPSSVEKSRNSSRSSAPPSAAARHDRATRSRSRGSISARKSCRVVACTPAASPSSARAWSSQSSASSSTLQWKVPAPAASRAARSRSRLSRRSRSAAARAAPARAISSAWRTLAASRSAVSDALGR